VMNVVDDGRKIEYCCPVCLASTYALDTAKAPRCWRGHGRMLPDSEEPRPKTKGTAKPKAPAAAPQAPPGGRPAATPATAARRSLAGL
jgi:hypothetical protein